MHALNVPTQQKSYAHAQAAFMREMGDPKRLCKYLAVSVAALAMSTSALAVSTYRLATKQRERIVVRVDDIGRAQAVGFTSTGEIKPAEAKFFLTNFAEQYYGRNRATIRRDYERSRMFLDTPLADARQAHERETNEIAKFIVGNDDEVQIEVRRIILGDMSRSPYEAQVDIDKVYKDRNGGETKREKWTASVTYKIAADIPNEAIPVNPLGFTVTSLREDQDFK